MLASASPIASVPALWQVIVLALLVGLAWESYPALGVPIGALVVLYIMFGKAN